MIEETKELIKFHEGFSGKPYKDTVGKLTIGYGRNLEDSGISIDEAESLLDNDVRKCLADILVVFPDFFAYPERVQMALLDMRYNLGLVGFLGFRKTIDLVKKQDFLAASKEMLDSKWAQQVGRRAEFLSNMMRLGGQK